MAKITSQAELDKKMSQVYGMPVKNFAKYSDGFSLTCADELDAYKLAYTLRFAKSTVVTKTHAGLWLIQVKSE